MNPLRSPRFAEGPFRNLRFIGRCAPNSPPKQRGNSEPPQEGIRNALHGGGISERIQPGARRRESIDLHRPTRFPARPGSFAPAAAIR